MSVCWSVGSRLWRIVPLKRMGSWGTKVRRLRRVEMSMSFREWLSMWMEPVSGRVMERRVEARVDLPEPCVYEHGLMGNEEGDLLFYPQWRL